ncbi:hypothetical protein ATE84_1643 [Aquimarina sp. MAR_2010_214]|uniref:hypothetical protein n=1 Tax=Aquimarina sp. MAR_2010_214 TaxID=1250026 RepID=UPI000C707B19|nr:hypothetical protein [Aquimarina sp. MAR_2010_214]PKV49611.1 hypothetical protein ATE84_1643 [Aquimarina sp. MAR_2010_214]
MKLKFALSIAFLLVCSISFGQDFKNDLSSVKTIDNQIQQEQYSTDEIAMTDRLIIQTPIKTKSKDFYSKKEWRKIKKQLKKNKRRVSNTKNSVYTYKVIDTIYIDIPSFNTVRGKSRLSGW